MIATCTLNPSLDYYMEFDRSLKNDTVNRSNLEYYEAGGKGINVSIVLNNLGIPTKAFGFLGGFTKDFYISLLAKYEEIRPNFTYIKGNTRINVKCTADQQITDMNATGPQITPDEVENLLRKVDSLYEGDYFVLAGNTPDYLYEPMIQLIKKCIHDKIRVVIDTNPSLMNKIVDSRPFMIKTTALELGEMLGQQITTVDEAVNAAKKVHEAGCRYVMVLLNQSEAILTCREGTYEASLLRGEKAVSFVGTGDSLTAGFLMNYLRSQDPLDSFRFGASCGSATVYSKGLATREKIDSFYKETEVKTIG